MKKLKNEIQNLLSSQKIQTIFKEAFSINSPGLKNKITNNKTTPSYKIRKTSIEYKEKGLIIPSTNVRFIQKKNIPHIPNNFQFQPINNFMGPMGFFNNNGIYNNANFIHNIPLPPPFQTFQSNPQSKYQNMNIINNITNIQNINMNV